MFGKVIMFPILCQVRFPNQCPHTLSPSRSADRVDGMMVLRDSQNVLITGLFEGYPPIKVRSSRGSEDITVEADSIPDPSGTCSAIPKVQRNTPGCLARHDIYRNCELAPFILQGYHVSMANTQ